MSKTTSHLRSQGPVSYTQTRIPPARVQWPVQGAGLGSSSCVGQRSNCETNSFFHAENILIPRTL